MRCHCCDRETSLGRKVKLRPFPGLTWPLRPFDPVAYHSYAENMTFRWAVVCLACYRILDSFDGTGFIGKNIWNLAGQSRGDRAAVVDEAKWQAFQRRQAESLGIDIQESQ